MRAVWVRNAHNEAFDVVPDGVIGSLSELPALINGWE